MNNNLIYKRYSELSPVEQSVYYTSVYSFLKSLVLEYPLFREWYEKLFTPDLNLADGREIIICENNYELAGVAILKRSPEEKKFCTLRVSRKYQKNGIGKALMEQGMEWLEDDKPLLSIHRYKYRQFEVLFNYYGFSLEQKRKGYYNLFGTELVFNGILPDKDIVLNKFELLDLTSKMNLFISNGGKDIGGFLNKILNELYIVEKLRQKAFINL